MSHISDKIYKIGTDMVKNHPQYSDVVCDPKNGIIPRCLIYEENGRDASAQGSVIVGINPGRLVKSSVKANDEREFYKSEGGDYNAVLEFWNKEMRKYKYYKYGRQLVDQIGLGGPILWTELVKCEVSKGVELSVQTICASIHKYLFKELEIVPKDWPLIAVSNIVFKILSHQYSNRIVIGIPHITNSRGQFHKLLSKNNELDPGAEKHLYRVLADGKFIATRFKCTKDNCRFDYSYSN